ncbi:MAG: rod shape-determining protein RodA [Bdellovibrionales bacterium]|nr:rod shape-determining protein RodA [Bdellovibrionales bacterium]
MLIDRRVIAHFDLPLFLVAMLIPTIGLVVQYSAGYDPNGEGVSFWFLSQPILSVPFVKQLTFLAIGLVAALIGASLSSNFLNRWAYPLYWITIVLLVAVLLFGTVSHGSRRWISLGGFNFQPAELAKVSVIFVLARYLSKVEMPRFGFTLKQLTMPGLLLGFPMALVMRQPDLGTALSIGIIGASMILFVGIRPKVLASVALIIIISGVPAWHSLYPYQQRRILTLLDPAADPRGSGYHVNQSKIAVGSGELSGKGFLQGTQTQLEFLPEHTTDFVFSVLSEEWGFLGAVSVLGLYFLLLSLILRIGLRCRDFFSSLICFGVAVMLFFHMTVNIGMVLGLLPVVGLTLPLFSYGGSSMIMFMFSIGVVLGIGMRRFQFGASGSR